jgi:hypothetical protein
MEDAHASYHRRRLTDEKDAPSYSQSGYLHSAFVSIGWLWEFSREICEPSGLWSEAFYSACTVVRVSSFLSYLTPGPLPCGSIPTGKVLPPGFRLMQTGSNTVGFISPMERQAKPISISISISVLRVALAADVRRDPVSRTRRVHIYDLHFRG